MFPMFCFCTTEIILRPRNLNLEHKLKLRWNPNHVTPVFFHTLDLKDSEKLGVTFRTHSFLLENLKKVLKIIIFWKKLEKLYSLMVLAKYY